jgi:hypothetical protein
VPSFDAPDVPDVPDVPDAPDFPDPVAGRLPPVCDEENSQLPAVVRGRTVAWSAPPGYEEKGAQLPAVMRRQAGAASTAQLHASGLGDNAIARLVARRVIERRHRAVYVDALAPLASRGHLFAALLACNETAFISHRTAAAIHGLRPLNVHAIEVTVVADHTPRHDGFIVHRTSRVPLPGEVRELDGLRIATPSRTTTASSWTSSGPSTGWWSRPTASRIT